MPVLDPRAWPADGPAPEEQHLLFTGFAGAMLVALGLLLAGNNVAPIGGAFLAFVGVTVLVYGLETSRPQLVATLEQQAAMDQLAAKRDTLLLGLPDLSAQTWRY